MHKLIMYIDFYKPYVLNIVLIVAVRYFNRFEKVLFLRNSVIRVLQSEFKGQNILLWSFLPL